MNRTNSLPAVSLLLLNLIAGPAAGAFQLTPPNRLRLLEERPQRIQTAKTVLETERVALGLSTDDTFTPTASFYDELGRLHVRFCRFYKGVRVLGGDLKVGVDASGAAGRVNTRPESAAAMPPVKPSIPMKEMQAILARELRARESDLSVESELVIQISKQQPTLAWLARVDGDQVEPMNYLVDAHTGAVLKSWPATVEALSPEQTKGQSLRYGEVDIDHVRNTIEDRYELQDPLRGMTRVYDMQDSKPTSGFKGTLYTQDPADPELTTWGDGQDWKFGDGTFGPRGQTAAVEAYYGGRLTWDMLKNVFGREGLDDAGSPLKLRVHVRKNNDEPYGDAYWDGTYANFGDGGESDSNSRTDTTTVAHELGHGLWDEVVTTDNESGERRGLNEGHGDIQGTIVNHYRELAAGAGSVIPTNTPENMSLFMSRSVNPWGYYVAGQPGLPYYVDGMGDYEEHVQGCAYGRMFATLAMGAPSVEEYESGPACETDSGAKFSCLVSPILPQGMAGIGMHKAARIWYLATSAYLDGKPTFPETRDAYLQAAEDLFGPNSPEYKSVMNAWAAIQVGDEAVDAAAPTVAIGGPILNNYEQSLVVAVVGKDDIGVDRMEFYRNGKLEQEVNGAEWLGLIDLSTVSFGNYTLNAVAYDSLGKSGATSKPLPYKGANYLLRNRGFEQGSDNWNQSGGAQIKSAGSRAFLGSGYAAFTGNGWVQQKFSVPSGIIGLWVGYRVAVDPAAGNVDSFEQLDVEILNSGGSLLETIDTIHANFNTSDSVYRNYKQIHHPMGLDYAGKDFILSFRTSSAKAGRFRIDNVYIAYDGVPTGDLLVEVDEAEGSVTFQVKNIEGIEPSQIKEVRVAQPGTESVRLGSQLMAVLSTDQFNVNTKYQVAGSIIDVLDNKVADLGPVNFTVKLVNQLIMNPSFESGSVWWDLGGAAEAIKYDPAWGEGNAAFLGDHWVRLGGQGIANHATLRQTVDIPSSALNVKLTFRLRINSGELLPGDVLNVNVLEFGTYDKLATLTSIWGMEETDTADNYLGHEKFNGFDLTAYRGKKVILEFEAVENDGLVTTFHIDNVGLTYSTLGIAP